jgi:hypothetical protein
VVVRAGLGIRVYDDSPRPELLGAGPRGRDRGGTVHAGRLGSIRVEVVSAHDANSVRSPVDGRRGLITPRNVHPSSMTRSDLALVCEPGRMDSGFIVFRRDSVEVRLVKDRSQWSVDLIADGWSERDRVDFPLFHGFALD